MVGNYFEDSKGEGAKNGTPLGRFLEVIVMLAIRKLEKAACRGQQLYNIPEQTVMFRKLIPSLP